MVITDIERHKKNTDMLSIYIDEKFAFTIAEEDYLRLHLYEKKEMLQEEIDYIRNDVNFRAAKSTAIKFLALKLRPEREVKKKLEDEGFDRETVERVVNELKAMGYINDTIYTQKYVFDRSKLKPKAKKLIKYELQNKGIGEETIDAVLAEWETDDADVAAVLVRRKFGKYDWKDEKIRRKIYAFLMHRGYSYEVVENILRGT